MGVKLERATIRALLRLPRRARRLLAGRPKRADGRTLDLDTQLGLRLFALARRPPLEALTPAQARVEAERSLGLLGPRRPHPVAEVRDLDVPGGAGPRPARLYRPVRRTGPAPTLLYLHGGGHVVCDLDTHDDVCRRLATRSRVDVVSLDYRLAPEHRFPAAYDDAVAAFEALRSGRVPGVTPSFLAMGGDSAGGNLTAALSVAATRDGRPGPDFQLLFYPLLDGTFSFPSYRTFAKGVALDDTEIAWFRSSYLGPNGDPTDLRYSPLLVDEIPPSLPPTYLATAGFDPLRDEGFAWAERLEAAGVPVTHRCHDGLIHGFVSFADVLTAAREAIEQAADALAAAVGASGEHRG